MQEWHWIHQVLTKPKVQKELSEEELAYTTFFLNRCNRSGILNAGPIGGINQNGNWKLDARFNKTELIKRIQKIALYKDRIHLFNLDAIKFLRWVQKQGFRQSEVICYLDPPYVEQGKQLYNHYFTEKDHKSLAYLLQKKFKHHWIVSYDDHPIIHNSYKEVTKNIFEFNYYANQTKVGRELVICSKMLSLPDMCEHYSRTKYIDQQYYKAEAI
jgi:DNA adenine methylase